MKKITTLITASLLTLTAMAQQPYKVYCSISERHSFTSTTAVINYGQERLARNNFVDDWGNDLRINSLVAAANYLSKLGWVFEDSYVTGEDANRCVWIMSKMVTSDAEITEGFCTREMYQNNFSGGCHITEN